jgi:hypothetical protein
VGTKGPGRRPKDEGDVWREIGDLFARGQAQNTARFDRCENRLDRVETDLGTLKADVSILKTDVQTKGT